ncbi:SpoVA/SpoVAEb family sporulation membrane protein [Clostridium scatologenes]|uniref:Stage v sporulation protein ac n=1 Tax=Clostridium scatologenes TaxID=1548 RepID=A0A0E3GS73_CLOSL|nr:SpoVA/SpoVAEb family sporulation membrane protein [Clostridium scatologenes]AKA71571.1 stage v sporulation protein ac [Clostridium scatologenes]
MGDIKIQTTNISPKEVETRNEKLGWFKSCIYSGIIGGLISVLAHVLSIIYAAVGVPDNISLVVTLLTLLLIGALTTALGWYSKLDKYGPAGGMLPTTGLAGAITGTAIQSKKNGESLLENVYKGFMSVAPILFWGWVTCVVAGIVMGLVKI